MRVVYVLVGWLAFIAVCQSLTGCTIEAKTPEQRKADAAQATSKFEMVCTTDLTGTAPGANIKRCENDEIVCYALYEHSLVCHWKPEVK
jgi:hypothetical protein